MMKVWSLIPLRDSPRDESISHENSGLDLIVNIQYKQCTQMYNPDRVIVAHCSEEWVEVVMKKCRRLVRCYLEQPKIRSISLLVFSHLESFVEKDRHCGHRLYVQAGWSRWDGECFRRDMWEFFKWILVPLVGPFKLDSYWMWKSETPSYQSGPSPSSKSCVAPEIGGAWDPLTKIGSTVRNDFCSLTFS